MIKKLTLSAALVLGLGTAAHAAGGAGHIEDFDFSFEGPFGTFDHTHTPKSACECQTLPTTPDS